MNLLALSSVHVGVGPSDFDGDILRLILMIAIPLGLVQLILLITALVSLVKKQVRTEDKLIWGVIIVLVNLIGPIVYFAIGSSMLDQKAAALEDERETENKLQ